MVSVYWLLVGAGLLALEAFGVPGVGFLFAGLAAIIVGAVVELGVIASENMVAQGAVFLVTTTMLAILLWKQLKGWRLNPNIPQYNNIVGTEAVVTQPLMGDRVGEVRWSGTLMRAKLADTTAAELPVGSIVIVRKADGNLLLVAGK